MKVTDEFILIKKGSRIEIGQPVDLNDPDSDFENKSFILQQDILVGVENEEYEVTEADVYSP